MRSETDQHGLTFARVVTREADCTRRQVGAVIMRPDGLVISAGWNAGTREKSCTMGHCPRASSDVAPGSSYDTGPGSCIAVHAEQRAVIKAGWEQMWGSSIYITDQPCDACMRMLEATPLHRAVWPDGEVILNGED